MSNDEFGDVSILKTLEQLRRKNLLHDADKRALLGQLKSTWGRTVADDLLSTDRDVDPESLSILRKFSASTF